MRALFTAATGMEAQQVRIDAVANNLANVSTTGFKKSRAEFQDLFYETLQAPGAQSSTGNTVPTGVQIGHGVRFAAVSRIFGQGDRVNTGHELDLAIEGDGFFQVQKPDGETVYTRDGTFKRDRDGNVVTNHGYPLIPNIQIPTDTIQLTILADGTVSALQAGQQTPTDLGRIELARFVNPSGLRALGNNLFVPTEASGDPQTGNPDEEGFGAVSQGFLEMSNVNVAEELVNMILSQRAFEVNSRVMQTGDQMLQTAASIVR
ncbi:MAG TPA: flagellar basal-body rod protein FlgG [Myxococcota bacterium]|jgi:flagellar basal-body rod protein FlgG|nr:flagellar basal-body rod protein FlgG [Myxococcota bacterium]